jgi:hypothetical protein
MSIRDALTAEARVAFSRRTQPHWFRVVKWIVILAVVRSLWDRPSFWWWTGGASVLAITLHVVWRVKTRTWTRAWGGWDDVDTAQRNRRS